MNIMSGFFYHPAILFLRKSGSQFFLELQGTESGFGRTVKQALGFIQLFGGFRVGALRIGGIHTGYQNQLLLIVVKDNNPVKQH